MARKKYYALAFIFSFVFILGYSIGSNAIPFDDSLKSLYIQYFGPDNNEQYDSIKPIMFETDVASLIRISNEGDIFQKRKDIIQFIWKNDGGLPFEKMPKHIDNDIVDERYSDLQNLERIYKITVSMEHGIESYAYLFLAKQNNNELIIYHQGHGGDFVRGKKTIDYFLDKGYSIMAFTVPLYGMNNQPIVNLPNFGKIKLTHHDHFYFLDSDEFSSIKFFVEPVIVSLNYIESSHNFTSIHMIGISAGGWTTHLYSAIDDRISKSYPVGTTLPSYIRLNVPEGGDYEKNLADLYNISNFLELYVMGSYGNNREQIKIINKYDRCCNSGIGYKTFEDTINNVIMKLDKGSFKIFLDETHRDHKISDAALQVISTSLKN